MIGRSAEFVIGNEDGVFKCQTIRRVSWEDAYDPSCLGMITVTVAEFVKSGARTTPVRVRFMEGPLGDNPAVQIPTRKNFVPRRVKLGQ